jgi:hypothetical protein
MYHVSKKIWTKNPKNIKYFAECSKWHSTKRKICRVPGGGLSAKVTAGDAVSPWSLFANGRALGKEILCPKHFFADSQTLGILC